MATINVLMCGGRRTGKTSIMAAIQDNVRELFPSGDIVLNMNNSGHLINYLTETTSIFGYEYQDESSFIANQGSNSDSNEYQCKVYLQKRASSMDLNFTDVPGEWFIKAEYETELTKKMRSSQVLIIAIDSPHMMESKGKYHEVFNRATIITQQIKKALQANREHRMVLFVPVKCERYRSTQDHMKNRMPELLECVKQCYSDLISFLTSGGNEKIYTVGVTPCFTFGGAEYLRFLPPMDEDGNVELGSDGNPLKDLEKDPDSGLMVMTYLTEYLLLNDSSGDHYYAPENCEQPLLYILLYLIAVSRLKIPGFISNLWATFRNQPNQKILIECKDNLLRKTKMQNNQGESEEGFALLNDPLGMV